MSEHPHLAGNPIAPLPSRPGSSLTRSYSVQSPHRARGFSPAVLADASLAAALKDAPRVRRGTPAPLARTLSTPSLDRTAMAVQQAPFMTSSPTTTSVTMTPSTSLSSLSSSVPASIRGSFESFSALLASSHGLPSPKRRLTHARDDSFGASEQEREQLRAIKSQISRQPPHHGGGAASESVDATARRSSDPTGDASIFSSPHHPIPGGAADTKELFATPVQIGANARPGIKRQCTAPFLAHAGRPSQSSIMSDLATPDLTPDHHHAHASSRPKAVPSSAATVVDPFGDAGTPGDLVLDDAVDSSPVSEIITPERPFRLGSSMLAAAIPHPDKHQQAFQQQPQQQQRTPAVSHMSLPGNTAGQVTVGQMLMNRQHQSGLASPQNAGFRPQNGLAVTSPNKSKSLLDKDGDVWPGDLQVAFDTALRIVPRLGRRKILVQTAEGAKPLGRNELIANYIFRQTGALRTRKQVSSHIQVLKNVHKSDEGWMRLVGEPDLHENDNFSPEQAHAFGAYIVNGTLFPLGGDPFPLGEANSPTSDSPDKANALIAGLKTIGTPAAGSGSGSVGSPDQPALALRTASAHHAALRGLSNANPSPPHSAGPISPFLLLGSAPPQGFPTGASPLGSGFFSSLSSAAASPAASSPQAGGGLLGPALGFLGPSVDMRRSESTASLDGRMGKLDVRSTAGSVSPPEDRIVQGDATFDPPTGPVSNLPLAPSSFMMWAVSSTSMTAMRGMTEDEDEEEEEEGEDAFVFATLNENEVATRSEAVMIEDLDCNGATAEHRFPGIVDAILSPDAHRSLVHAEVRARLPRSVDGCSASPADVKAEVGVLSDSNFDGRPVGVAMSLIVGGKVALSYTTDLAPPAPAREGKWFYTAHLPGVFIGGLLKGTAEGHTGSPLVADTRAERAFVQAALRQATIVAEYYVVVEHNRRQPVLLVAYEFDLAGEGEQGTMRLSHIGTRSSSSSRLLSERAQSSGSPTAAIPQIREPTPAPADAAVAPLAPPPAFANGFAVKSGIVRPLASSPTKRRHASKNLSISIPDRPNFGSMLGVPGSNPSAGASPVGAEGFASRASTPGPLTPAIQIVHTPTTAPGAPGPGDAASIRRLEQTWATAATGGDLNSPAIAGYHHPASVVFAAAHQQPVDMFSAAAAGLEDTAAFEAALGELDGGGGGGVVPSFVLAHEDGPAEAATAANGANLGVPGGAHSAALSHMYALTAGAHAPVYGAFPDHHHHQGGPATPFIPIPPFPAFNHHHPQPDLGPFAPAAFFAPPHQHPHHHHSSEAFSGPDHAGSWVVPNQSPIDYFGGAI